MRFAGSNPIIQSMATYSGYRPGAISGVAQEGRSLQKQTATQAEAMNKENDILNEARLKAAELGIAAEMAQIPSTGEVIGSSLLNAAGNLAGPIASGMGGGGGGGGFGITPLTGGNPGVSPSGLSYFG